MLRNFIRISLEHRRVMSDALVEADLCLFVIPEFYLLVVLVVDCMQC
jgi:hypothetical protein